MTTSTSHLSTNDLIVEYNESIRQRGVGFANIEFSVERRKSGVLFGPVVLFAILRMMTRSYDRSVRLYDEEV